jgi:hypothetical protein
MTISVAEGDEVQSPPTLVLVLRGVHCTENFLSLGFRLFSRVVLGIAILLWLFANWQTFIHRPPIALVIVLRGVSLTGRWWYPPKHQAIRLALTKAAGLVGDPRRESQSAA